MATLTYSSTLATVVDQLLASANWQGDFSVAILRKEAIDWLMVNRPSYSVVSGRNVTFDYAKLGDERAKIDEYLTAINTTRRPAMFSRARVTGLGT